MKWGSDAPHCVIAANRTRLCYARPAEPAGAGRPWKKSDVRQIILDIVGTQSSYHFQAMPGVAHVSASIPDDENFLKINVQEFKVHNEYAELAYFKLRMQIIPEEHGNRQISLAGPGDSRLSVSLVQPKVEEVLDALSLASNRKIWVVTFSRAPRLTQAGMRRSISLWTNTPTEVDQPHWDVIRWGDPLPPSIANN
jgi:hypothetical protein